MRQRLKGDSVSYGVCRNINYTNVCTFGCGFCAFSKGKLAEDLRGAPYLLPLAEVARRTAEAWDRGASEVCMQGGIHPDFTGMGPFQVARRRDWRNRSCALVACFSLPSSCYAG